MHGGGASQGAGVAGVHAWQERRPLLRAVRILLQCILVYQNVSVQLQSGQIMAICLSETEAEARRHQNEVDRVAKTREAAELLSAKEDGNDDDSVLYNIRWCVCVGGGFKGVFLFHILD